MAGAESIVAELRAESGQLDALVAALPEQGWRTATPAPGWTIAHQIAHLFWTDRVAVVAVTDEAGFAEFLTLAAKNPGGFVDEGAEELAATPPTDLLAEWRQMRVRLHDELLRVESGRKLPWFGPPMSAASMATARLMETWAHGQDVADALGVQRVPTARLRHVCHLGVATRDHSFRLRGLPAPAADVAVELSGPDGALWTWGSTSDGQRVSGPALDFCLLVTQRRHRADTALVAEGDVATAWLELAQAYAGAPGPGRRPQ